MRAANDDWKAVCEALNRRSDELRSIVTSPLSTPDQIRQAMRDLDEANGLLAELNQALTADVAAVIRKIRELGGRTIKRVIEKPDGSSTTF